MNKRKISIKAISIGVAISLVTSSLTSVMLAIAWGIPFTVDKLESGYSNPVLMVSDLILSLACVFLGGYTAGMIAKNGRMLNSIIVGIVQLVINILAFLPQSKLSPIWYTVAVLLGTVPSAYFGGKIAVRKIARAEAI